LVQVPLLFSITTPFIVPSSKQVLFSAVCQFCGFVFFPAFPVFLSFGNRAVKNFFGGFPPLSRFVCWVCDDPSLSCVCFPLGYVFPVLLTHGLFFLHCSLDRDPLPFGFGRVSVINTLFLTPKPNRFSKKKEPPSEG